MGPLIVGFITTRILRTPNAPSSKHGVLLQHNAHTRTTTGPPITGTLLPVMFNTTQAHLRVIGFHVQLDERSM